MPEPLQLAGIAKATPAPEPTVETVPIERFFVAVTEAVTALLNRGYPSSIISDAVLIDTTPVLLRADDDHREFPVGLP